MNKEEEWKAIAGYEEVYEISNLGRVKSLKYGKERILKPKKCRGYLFVNLCRNGKVKKFLVHRLVGTAFIPNTMGFTEINHIDENKANNVVSNIEWVSRSYNMHYGTRTKRAAAALSKPVEASKYPDFRTIELRFASTCEAGRNGYGQRAVSASCNGRFNREGNNKYKNLYWRYAS